MIIDLTMKFSMVIIANYKFNDLQKDVGLWSSAFNAVGFLTFSVIFKFVIFVTTVTSRIFTPS